MRERLSRREKWVDCVTMPFGVGICLPGEIHWLTMTPMRSRAITPAMTTNHRTALLNGFPGGNGLDARGCGKSLCHEACEALGVRRLASPCAALIPSARSV